MQQVNTSKENMLYNFLKFGCCLNRKSLKNIAQYIIYYGLNLLIDEDENFTTYK